VIFKLVKKYGGTEDTALAQYEDARREVALLDDASVSNDALDRDLDDARKELAEAAAYLSATRKRVAGKLAVDVEALFPSLGLADGRFAVELRPLDHIGPDGAEDAEFTVALNVGHAARPLARIASGGELARVMLAVKTILARLDRVPTLVFDEVDAGIGGAVALQVGDAMRRVAEHHQVFAITHLPQIAARAHHHIVIAKDARSGVSTADTNVVVDEERVREVSRMLGGDPDSAVSREHARELLASASVVTAPTTSRTRAQKSGRR
jgi:DNA repair protein RecN (Recombination protein N)